MQLVKKIAIIGVGFMGGSLSLALKKKFPSMSIWGYARSKKSYNKLKKLKILDRVERDLRKVVEEADIVVLALPVEAIISYLMRIAPFLKKGAIVFDLGSSKKLIETEATRYLSKDVSFVGCHPLCGSEKSGAEFSCKHLYQGALCLITSSPKNKGVKTVKRLWEKLGSRVLFISPDLHDKILSCVSHVPHFVSFSLTHLVPDNYLKFSPSSFKDLTRISGSPPWVWADIFLSNRNNILKDLKRFTEILRKFECILKEGDKKKIIALIEKANKKQRLLMKDKIR